MKEIFNEYFDAPTWIQWLIMIIFLIIFVSVFLIVWKIKEKYYSQSRESREDVLIYKGIMSLTIIFMITLSILCSYIFSNKILISYYNLKHEIPAQVLSLIHI